VPISTRDLSDLVDGLSRWAAALAPEAGPVSIVSVVRPSAGWSNELVQATMAWPERTDEIVVRLPTIVPSFPVYDLQAQAAVQEALHEAGLPVPRPIAVEQDSSWLGAPFFVMECAQGRSVGDMPALDRWMTTASSSTQRAVQKAFVALLARVHRLDWRAAGLDAVVRGADDGLKNEVEFWLDYIDWAAEGAPTRTLLDAAQWCAATVPDDEGPPLSLCWGDARLGNVLMDDAGHLTAALDFELTSIAPAEMDLAWYLALDELTSRLIGRRVDGFLPAEELVSYYETQLGRQVSHLRWHEVFALVRSAAINERQARIAAQLDVAYPGLAGDDNPLLGEIIHRIEQYHPGT
jgi:aminoglycoside phosphotransferase (APT) family kinase protein